MVSFLSWMPIMAIWQASMYCAILKWRPSCLKFMATMGADYICPFAGSCHLLLGWPLRVPAYIGAWQASLALHAPCHRAQFLLCVSMIEMQKDDGGRCCDHCRCHLPRALPRIGVVRRGSPQVRGKNRRQSAASQQWEKTPHTQGSAHT